MREIELAALRRDHIKLDFGAKVVRLTLPVSKNDIKRGCPAHRRLEEAVRREGQAYIRQRWAIAQVAYLGCWKSVVIYEYEGSTRVTTGECQQHAAKADHLKVTAALDKEVSELKGRDMKFGDLRMDGEVYFIAARAFKQPCVDITGDASIFGNIHFENCRNEDTKRTAREGGGLRVGHSLTQHAGIIQFRNCSNDGHGGGLYAQADLTQKNGTVEFTDCSSNRFGGGLHVSTVTQNNGSIKFHNCRAKWNGGCLATGTVKQKNGIIEFHTCSSSLAGGGLWGGSVTQNNGTMKFKDCSSEEKGGGLYIESFMTQNNGTMEFKNCSSAENGGGLYVESFMTQNNGTMEFKNCSSEENGGGLFVDAFFTQNNGRMEFKNCSSAENGGGMYMPGKYDIRRGAAVFQHCVAKENGGGLWVHEFQQKAPVYFNNCFAALGGGLDAYMVNGTQPLHFHECQAKEAGGGIHIHGLEGSRLDNIHFEACRAGRASAIQARNLTITSLVLVDTFNQTVDAVSLKVSTASFQVSEGTRPALSMEAADLQIDSDVDCSQLRECRLIVTSTSSTSVPKLDGFQCSLGAGVAQHPAFGCLACPEGYTQIENVTNGPCRQCPKGASLCHAAKIQMMHGFMLHERNVSRPLHCPTKAACHGGELPANEDRPMCQKGYGGEGCASCIRDDGTLYLMPDSSVLACTPCAPDTASQLLQWCSFLSQRVVLFAVSAASIFAAGHADRVKNSGVYLNQLMAFAAVSGCVVTAVMQTETAQTMKNVAVEYLYRTAVFLSEAGSGQGSKSSHCLLSYLGFETTGLFGVHCLDVVVATSLVLLLSFKDFHVALVAGLNCFLPSILADFAKYAVCYSLEEDQTGGMEDLICNHLPHLPFGNLLGFLAVGASFLTVFVVSLLVWIRLSTSAKEDELKLPSHVAFLTNKYGEGRQYFEAERLVRKVLLATAAAFYPSTTFPALQMTGLMIITCASMCLYGIFHPYRQQIWNWSELGLLATAQLLIAVASAVISNEEQWDKTEIGQMSMIVTLGAIVTAVCSAFMVKIAMEVWRERRPGGSSHSG
eukprot:s503_g30.t2